MSRIKAAVAEATTEFVTIKDVPILGVGTYPLSTGVTTFTEEDLADAVRAANEDPAVKNPRLKLGHTDEGWQAGEPSFGYFTNLHLSENGQEILADLETFPWLAEVLPVAYPNRSIEGDFGRKTETGKFYRLVISAVSLLGIELPGVTTLDDLREVFTSPEVEVVAVKASGKPKVVVKAQVDAADVQRSFYGEVAQGDRYWWWIRSVRLEPNEVIAEDEESGSLYRIPFTVADKKVTFGDPVEVYEEYVDAPKDKEDTKQTATAGRQIARWHIAARSRIRATNKEKKVTPEELRSNLGLPEDATDEQVAARIAELRAAEASQEKNDPSTATPAEDAEDGEQTGGTPTPDQGSGTEAPPAPTTASAASGVVTVDAAALAQLQRDAAMGRQAREQQISAERSEFLDRAIRAGKFAPSRRDHFAKLMAADDAGTRQLINGLADGLIPVEEVGGERMDTNSVAAGAQDDLGYDPNLLTQAERERIARARQRMEV